MRIRHLLLAVLLVGAFVLITNSAHWRASDLLQPFHKTTQLWSAPDTALGAGLSTDEQNNIDVYKMARAATVNITSIVYRENWFFQMYPEKGTGSGFIISPEGQILTNYHVINGTAQLTVTLEDKKVYKAKVLGADSRNDL